MFHSMQLMQKKAVMLAVAKSMKEVCGMVTKEPSDMVPMMLATCTRRQSAATDQEESVWPLTTELFFPKSRQIVILLFAFTVMWP